MIFVDEKWRGVWVALEEVEMSAAKVVLAALMLLATTIESEAPGTTSVLNA